jgi:putative SOS response-associated peptidase YedK
VKANRQNVETTEALMCGRVFDPEEVSETKLNPLKGRAGDRWLWAIERRYNVPPTMPLPVMPSKEGVRTIEPMRWGIIPSWAKDLKGGFSTFNARSDGVDTKPTFKGAWKAGRRCLVLAGGFFEWRKAGAADKQPFAFAMGNREIMTMAGLWEAWKNPEDGQWLRSCTIITTDAKAGPVEYVDLTQIRMKGAAMLDRFFYKHRAFEWEREFRLAISLRAAEEFGLRSPSMVFWSRLTSMPSSNGSCSGRRRRATSEKS